MPKNDISKAFNDLNKQIKQSISQVEGEFSIETNKTPEGLWRASAYESGRSHGHPFVIATGGTEESALEAVKDKIAEKLIERAFK